MFYAIAGCAVAILVLIELLARQRWKIGRLQQMLRNEQDRVRQAENMADNWASKYSNSVRTNEHLKTERDRLQRQLMVNNGGGKN